MGIPRHPHQTRSCSLIHCHTQDLPHKKTGDNLPLLLTQLCSTNTRTKKGNIPTAGRAGRAPKPDCTSHHDRGEENFTLISKSLPPHSRSSPSFPKLLGLSSTNQTSRSNRPSGITTIICYKRLKPCCCLGAQARARAATQSHAEPQGPSGGGRRARQRGGHRYK